MRLCYSGKSAPSARAIAEVSENITINRGPTGDVNWGRYRANTRLNPDIRNSTNKRVMRELFARNGVPMPKLISRGQAQYLASEGYPIVGRPDTHSRKRGFWLCKSMDDVRLATRGWRRKRAATHFMEFVEAEREYRVHIFKDKSIRISEKEFYQDGGERKVYTRKPQHPVKHVRKAAKKAVSALGLDFGAVDVLANDDECWVLEVNAAPGLGGTMPQLYAETFLAWERGEWDERTCR